MPEWLEADAAGGFASGTSDTIRTRRYHALLLVQTTTGRVVLVNGFEAWIDLPSGPTPHHQPALRPRRHPPRRRHPHRRLRHQPLAHLDLHPPRRLHPHPGDLLRRRPNQPPAGPGLQTTQATLHVRPLFSGRGYHSLHHENPALDFTPDQAPGLTRWRPYPGLPPITAWGGAYRHDPLWFRPLPLHAGTSPRPRPHRGPGRPRNPLMGSRHPCHPGPPRRRRPCLARPDPRRSHRRGTPPLAAPAPRGPPVRRSSRRPRHHPRRLSLVHRLGPRHLHQHPRPPPRPRPHLRPDRRPP